VVDSLVLRCPRRAASKFPNKWQFRCRDSSASLCQGKCPERIATRFLDSNAVRFPKRIANLFQFRCHDRGV